ncbi:MAG: RimK family alpha-L-glutamate ligase [Spirosomataceae bacterium]
MKKRIGLVTCARLPELNEADQVLLPTFEKLGWEAQPVIWDDPKVNWDSWDALLIRNTWDYYTKADAFRTWLSQIKTPIWNSASLVQWNFHKFYLKELQDNGVSIIPTLFWDSQTPHLDIPWEQVVLKPAISAGSYQTQRVLAQDLVWPTQGEWLIQPFLPEIQQTGEYSMIFFGDQFSHGVRKKPVEGDFRVQRQYGGQYELFEPDQSQMAAAKRALKAVPSDFLYARVDGVMVSGAFWLMEIELIEPDLYFEFDPNIAHRLVQALAQKIEN